jgi:ATP-binding cassette subfamily B protein
MKQVIDRPASKNLGPLKKLLPFARPYYLQIGLALLFLVLGAAATLSLPVAVRHMIDLGFSPEHQDEISRYFAIMFGVAVAMAVFTSLRYFWVTWLGQRVVADLRDAVYKKVLAMSPEFFETTRTGEVLSRINTDTTLVETVVGSTFSISLRSVVMLIGSAVMMTISSPKLAGMIALVIPGIIVPIVIASRIVRKFSKQSQDRIADCSAMATETINAVQTVQAYAQEKAEEKRFSSAVLEAFKTNVKRIRAEAIMGIAVIIMMFGGVVLVLWMGARSVIDGTLSAGVLSQFVLYAILAAGTMGALSNVIGELMRAAGALERITELLSMTPAIRSPKEPKNLPVPVQGNIRIEGLEFAYPSRLDTPILQNINIEIAAGETVALVGPSGAGKSTFFQLLMRFYDPTKGSISIEGIDIRDLDLASLRM